VVRIVGAALLVLAAALVAAPPAAASGPLTIAQVSPEQSGERRAYVQLLNRSGGPVSLAGLALQWRAPGEGSWAFVTGISAVDLPAGRSFLIARGDPRDDPAAASHDQLSLGLFLGPAGTLALVRGDVLLSCASAAACAADDRIADLIAFGGVAVAEGAPVTGQAPAVPGAVVRRLGGCLDTDSNAADAEVLASAAPVTLASGTVTPCSGPGTGTAAPVASCGTGALKVTAGREAARPVSATDADDRVNGFSATIEKTGTVDVRDVVVSPGAGAPGSARIVVPGSATPGSYTVAVTAQSGGAGLQRATCTFPVTVVDAPATRTTTTVRRCIVPSLGGLTLTRARARLKKARCKVGKVRRLKGAKKPLVVRRQSRKGGTRLKVNTKIALTLGTKRRR
jgi:hypothetical protein